MSLSSIVAVALKALRRNLFRSVLTMVGVAVGVAAVITIVALGSGAQAAIEEDVASAGTNLVIVSAGNFTRDLFVAQCHVIPCRARVRASIICSRH